MINQAMKHKTIAIHDLHGAALRWMMALSLGYSMEAANDKGRIRVTNKGSVVGSFMPDNSPLPPYLHAWQPDIDFTQGGPLIQRFNVGIDFIPRPHDLTACVASCGEHSISNQSLLVAVCHAIIMNSFDARSKVSVPSFLLHE